MEGAFVQNLLQNYTPILYVFDLKIHGREPYIIRVSIHLNTIELEDPALVVLKQWPVSRQYKDNPEKLPGLEQQV